VSRTSLRATLVAIVLSALGTGPVFAQDPKDQPGQDPNNQAPAPGGNPNLPTPIENLPKPDPVPDFPLAVTLETHPVRRGTPGPNWIAADATALPKDRPGIWILEFTFRPVRMMEVEIPGKGRRMVHYLYYRVVNRTGKPRRFVPQFTIVDDKGKRSDDVVLPRAVKNIQAREDPRIDLLGAVNVMGMIPPSTKEGVDDAVYGVAVWDNLDFNADSFKVYVRGLSDGFQVVQPPGDAKPFTRFKALRIDFQRPGDARRPNEREIRLMDPPFDWVYYP